RGIFNYGETVLLNIVGQRIVADAQHDLARNLVVFDLARLNAVHSGEFISGFLYDATLLRDAVTKGVAACGKEIVSLVFLFGVMLYQDWQLSLVSIVTLPVISVVARNLGRATRKASNQGMVETAALTTALSEMLDGRRIVKAYGLESKATARVAHR